MPVVLLFLWKLRDGQRFLLIPTRTDGAKAARQITMPVADSFSGLQAARLQENDAAYRHYLGLVAAQEAARRTALAERAAALEIPRYFQQRDDILTERAQDRAERRAERASQLDYTRSFDRQQLDLQRAGIDARKVERADIEGQRTLADSRNLFERLIERANRGQFGTWPELLAAGGSDPRITEEQRANLKVTLGAHQLQLRRNFEADAEGVARDLTDAFRATPEYKAAQANPAQLETVFGQYYRKLKGPSLRYVSADFPTQSFRPRRDISELPSDVISSAPGYRPPVVAAPATTALTPVRAPTADPTAYFRDVLVTGPGPTPLRSGPTVAPLGSAPVRISTRAEFEALPRGTRFINPADGRVLVK